MQKAKTRTPLSKVALAVAFGLAGCNQSGLDNQIEKCVQAVIKTGEPYKDTDTRNRIEAEARLACLEAASGTKK